MWGAGWTSPLVFFETIFYFVVWLKQPQPFSHLERSHVLDEIRMLDFYTFRSRPSTGLGVVLFLTVLSVLGSGPGVGLWITFIFRSPSERGIFLGPVVRWCLQ